MHERALEIASAKPKYASVLPKAEDRPYVARAAQARVRAVDPGQLRQRAIAWTRQNQRAVSA